MLLLSTSIANARQALALSPALLYRWKGLVNAVLPIHKRSIEGFKQRKYKSLYRVSNNRLFQKVVNIVQTTSDFTDTNQFCCSKALQPCLEGCVREEIPRNPAFKHTACSEGREMLRWFCLSCQKTPPRSDLCSTVVLQY